MDFEIKYLCPKCREMITSATGYLDNKEIINLSCPNDHEFTAFIAIPRFVLYFNKGIDALAEHYYYEGYSWIYTSLEVFRKDFVKAYLNIVNGKSIKSIDNTFDKRFKRSENIYGAYAFAYLSYFDISPDTNDSPYPIIANEEIKRRNEMFHEGKMPSLENIMEDFFRIYQHMFYGYQSFKSVSETSSVPTILEYYGNRYLNWRASHPVDAKIMSDDFVLLNSDLGIFEFNRILDEFKFPYSTIDEIISASIKNKDLYKVIE